MKRSKKIDLTIVTLLAASFSAACAQDPDLKHCVDPNGVVVDDSQCQNQGGPVIPGRIPFHWYYGGSRIFTPGSRVSGGSYTPSSGHVYSTPSTVSRGGFGSIGRGSFSSAGE